MVIRTTHFHGADPDCRGRPLGQRGTARRQYSQLRRRRDRDSPRRRVLADAPGHDAPIHLRPRSCRRFRGPRHSRALIMSSGAVAAYESIGRFIHPRPVTLLWDVMVASLIGFFGNEGVAIFRIRVGRQIGSAALIADGYHARVDGWTSL